MKDYLITLKRQFLILVSFIGNIIGGLLRDPSVRSINIEVAKHKIVAACDEVSTKMMKYVTAQNTFTDILLNWLDIMIIEAKYFDKSFKINEDELHGMIKTVNCIFNIICETMVYLHSALSIYILNPVELLKANIKDIDFNITKTKIIIDHVNVILKILKGIKTVIKNEPNLLFKYTLYYNICTFISKIEDNLYEYNKFMSKLEELKNNTHFKDAEKLYEDMGYDINEKISNISSETLNIYKNESKDEIGTFIENVQNIIDKIKEAKDNLSNKDLAILLDNYIFDLNRIIFKSSTRVHSILTDEFTQIKKETEKHLPCFIKNDIIITELLQSGVLVLSLDTEKEEYICKFGDMPMTIQFSSQDKWHKIGTYTDSPEAKKLLNSVNNNRKKTNKK